MLLYALLQRVIKMRAMIELENIGDEESQEIHDFLISKKIGIRAWDEYEDENESTT